MKPFNRITCPATAVATGLLATLFLLASCSRDENDASGSEIRARLTVSTVAIVAGGVSTNTRVPVLPTPVTTGTLGVGIRAANGYTAQTGLVYTYSNGAWTSSSASVVLSKDPVSLYAYYPQDSYTPDGDGKISLATQAYTETKDLGYALSGGENVCSTHPYAGFVLKHAYARVKVDITFSSFFADATVLSMVGVTAGGLYADAKLALTDGTITMGTSLPKLEWTSGQALNTIGRKYTGDMLVVPSATVTNAKLNIALGNGSSWTSDLGSALSSLEAGKSYHIRAFMGAVLIIDKVEVEDWTTGAAQDGDTQFE